MAPVAFVPAVASLAVAYTEAWNTRRPEAVAAFFAPSGVITINDGAPWPGRAGVAAMAAGFFADIPDLALACDGVRAAGSRAIYTWTFTGHHMASGRALCVSGWEEWRIDADGAISESRGWFDAADYARQCGIDG